jgi:Holliday junction DNA helicase RuvB
MEDQETENQQRIITDKKRLEDEESNIRPQRLAEYIGQDSLKDNLCVFIEAAKKREEPLEHIIFYGPPGLGKTTLANVIANEMQVSVKVTSGPAIERPGDLAAILTNLQANDILFIDEIHRLNRVVEEVLYPAMEDFELDIVLGKGPSARSIRLSLPKFTLIGATTKIGALSSPLRDRFGFLSKLEFYTEAEICKIIERAAGILKIAIDYDGAIAIARRSRATPRIANRLLRRVRDWAQVKGIGKIESNITEECLQALNIDNIGLDKVDVKFLKSIIEKFNGGPVGLDTIAAMIAEDPITIEDVYEPYLLQLGFIERTPRGRIATRFAYEHLGIKLPDNIVQTNLF